MTDAVPIQAQGAQIVPGEQALVPVPSGQSVHLQEVVWNVPGPDGMTLRFRFVAPQIAQYGGTIDPETAATDMAYLCTNYALPRLNEFGPAPAQIVISLSDREVPFGETVPEATQYFDAYTYQDGTCIWEMF